MFLHSIVLHIQRWPQCNIRSEWLPHLGQEREKNFLISDKKSLDVRSPTSSPGGLIIAVQYPIWPRSLWTLQVTPSCSSFHCTVVLFGDLSQGSSSRRSSSSPTTPWWRPTSPLFSATSMKAAADCKSVNFSNHAKDPSPICFKKVECVLVFFTAPFMLLLHRRCANCPQVVPASGQTCAKVP